MATLIEAIAFIVMYLWLLSVTPVIIVCGIILIAIFMVRKKQSNGG